jgi:hypothetical protein
MNICILIDYIIDCAPIYLHDFLTLKTIIINFCKMEGALVPKSQKHFMQTLLLFHN